MRIRIVFVFATDLAVQEVCEGNRAEKRVVLRIKRFEEESRILEK